MKILLKYWKEKILHLEKSSSLVGSCIRIAIATGKGFIEHQGFLRISALTFYSLLSIVPLLAALFGIAKGFSLDQLLEKDLLIRFEEQRDILILAIQFAHSLLDHASGSLIAGLGTVLLLWSAIKLLSNIEESLNAVWNVPSPRPWARRIIDYTAIIMILPIFFVLSTSVTLFFTPWLLIKVVSIIFSSLLFTLLYFLVPNIRIPFLDALIGGILAGTLYQIVQGLFIKTQLFVLNYGAIYGSFAILPLFLVWLQISWFIVLLGAEICRACEKNEPVSNPSFGQRKLLSLFLCQQIAESYRQGVSFKTAKEWSQQLFLPLSLTQLLLKTLVQAKLVIEMNDSEESRFFPSRDLSFLTLQEILDILEKEGKEPIDLAQFTSLHQPAFESLCQKVRTSPKSFLFD